MAPIIAFLVAALVYFGVQVRSVLKRLDVIAVEEISRQTGRAVRIRSIDTSPLGTAVIHDLDIANGKSFSKGKLLSAERVVVRFKWRDLVYGRKPAIQIVESVRVERPTILLQRFANGKLNIQDLMKPKPGPKRPPFIGVLDVTDGKLVFEEWSPRLPGKKPVVIRVSNLSGTFDASSAPDSYVYNLSGDGAGRKLFDSVSASGSIDNRKSSVSIDLDAKNANAAFWTAFLFKTPSFSVRQGSADASISLTKRKSGIRSVWDYAGSVMVQKGSVNVAGFKKPAENVRGVVKFAGQIFNFNMSASMVNTPVKFTGRIVGTAKPRLDLHVESSRADYAKVLQATTLRVPVSDVKLVGAGPLTLDIVGPADNLVFNVKARVPSVTAMGYQVSDLAAAITYSGKTVQVERASGNALGGKLVAHGTIDLARAGTGLTITGQASGIELASVPQLRQSGLRGVASGRFNVTGTAQSPNLVADVKLPSGKFNNLVFRNAVASLKIGRSGVDIGSLTASVAGGSVKASGSVTAKSLDLKTSATGVDIAKLSTAFGIPGVGGVGDFNGSVSGSFADPRIVGKAEIFEGKYKTYAFDYARGGIIATKSKVTFDKATVRVLPAEIAVSGYISDIDTKAPRLNLDLSVAEAPADRLMSLMQMKASVHGTVSGSVNIQGRIDDLTAEGSVSLADGSIQGYPIKEARADLSYSGGAFDLSELTAKSDGSLLSASGTLSSDGDLNFRFDANNVALVQFAELTKPYVALAGTANASGTLTGTIDSPSLIAELEAVKPTINTVPFDRFSARVKWDGSTVTGDNLRLGIGASYIEMPHVAYNTDDNTIAVTDAKLVDFPFAALYNAVVSSPSVGDEEGRKLRDLLAKMKKPETGTINGVLNASGPIDDIQAKAKLSVGGVSISNIKNATVDIEASADQGKITLDNLNATANVEDESVRVSASGTILDNGNTNLAIEANNIDLAALSPATGPLGISGVATITTNIVGPIASPQITASVEMVDPEIYGVKFDRLRASQIAIGAESIDISPMILTRGSHSFRIQGSVPWSWSELTVPFDKPIDMHAAMDSQSLDILEVFAGVVKVDKDKPGSISANLDFTGTLANPNLNGQVQIADGNLTIENAKSGWRLKNRFNNLQASVRFVQDRVIIDNLSGESSEGGSFHVVPGGTISIANLLDPKPGQPRGIVSMAVMVDKFGLSEQNLFGYQEQVNGSFTSGPNGISISGSLLQPLISGQVNIANATAVVSTIPAAKTGAVSQFAINPQFDLNFTLKDKVLFKNPSLLAQLQGGGRLGGSLSSPLVTANVTVASGQITLPTQRMRITQGSAKVDWAGAGTPPRVLVDMRAETSVMATSPTGERKHYKIILTVQGPLDNLNPENVSLRSDPVGLSRPQMLAALGHFGDIYGNGEIALRQQLRDVFAVAVSPFVFGKLENAFIEAFRLEDFNIQYGFDQPLALFASRQLFGNFHIAYWQIVTGAPATTSATAATYSLRLSYKLRDWLDVGYATDSTRVGVLQATYTKRF